MALSRQEKYDSSESATLPHDDDHDNNVAMSSTHLVGTTVPKGRPTPKRSSKTPNRGPIAPAPMTAAQARSRRKALAGPKPTRQERQERKARQRQQMENQRQRMIAGEESALPPRDRGPVRRLARDIVDSRYNMLGLFMPVALVLFCTMLVVHSVQVQTFVSIAMMALMATMVLDSIVLGVIVVQRINIAFPQNTESRLRLGLYAASRASTVRRMRVPRPQVPHGVLPWSPSAKDN